MLANPNISFKYLINGKVIYQTYGDGLESAMINVYGYSVINNCFYIETEKNGIKIKGYIGKHNYVKSNRTYQTLIVNGRYVLNQTINSAITNAYSAYLMKRQYPFFVLHVDLPAEFVDVNVHPNKTEVRFQNNQVVYGTIYSVISSVLDGTNKALDIVKVDLKKDEDELKSVRSEIKENTENFAGASTIEQLLTPYKKTFGAKKSKVQDYSVNTLENKATKEQLDIFAQNKAYIEKLEKSKINQDKIEIEDPLVFIGQAFNTFLIYQKEESLYIVDQHAAHERLLYDKMLSYTEGNIISQPLLVPLRIKPNPLEQAVLEEILPIIKNIGIEMEKGIDGSYMVSVVPIELIDIDFEKFLQEMTEDYSTYNKKTPSVILEKIMQKACKSAIKAGDKLTRLEIETLTRKLNENFGLKCPHGRPIDVKITKTEIYKWFKRIV
jgi:DNA mismatch repair protein MutL